MDGLEAEWGEEVQVMRLNVHGAGVEPLLQQLNFRFTPTFVLLSDGSEVWRSVGSLDPDAVKQAVSAQP